MQNKLLVPHGGRRTSARQPLARHRQCKKSMESHSRKTYVAITMTLDGSKPKNTVVT
ncbi:hypothetical cytosolic protein [Syntrophus aciditrophicus SB]|uniref:Hypothetical cytosolic protein n=1 Tax=Syntrophus aciditrophicus (strain SB) TaxID=56780 RepID=Q2LVC6_SYNAS|nr:hypothetical cytosolic protein [Syntrophus aciditrophicus SB]